VTGIILFDKPRHLKQHDREIQIENSKTSKTGFLWNSPSSKPVARIIVENSVASKPTFLASDAGIARKQNTRQSIVQVESDGEIDPSSERSLDPLDGDQYSSSDMGDSTRARLLQSMHTKPLELYISEDQPLSAEIRRRLISIIADDWNLVLSQMRLTLDDIDCKISDDHELHENVPAWRRLLCSWRVNVIEYSSRLSDEHRLAEYQAQARRPTSRTRRVQRCRSGTRNSSMSSISHIGNHSEEEVSLLVERYEDMKASITDIAGRIDRSFQALMSSMSIVESEKAISQGTAVARLTE
jgi:hypothetical protein